MIAKHKTKAELKEDQPPIFKTWKQWYALVLVNLVVLIILFYFFTIAFSH